LELFKLLGTIAIENGEANNAIDNTTDRVKKSESKIVNSIKKIGSAIVAYFAIDKITAFGKEVVNVAAEVSAEASAFEQIMGDYAEVATEKVGKIAEATGMVDSRLTPYMTSMTAKFKGLGYDIEEATDLASTGLTIAADAAAFWDKSLDESMGHLNSFVNGSYEGGEAIGLFANETTLAAWSAKNLKLKWDDLTEKEKQFARLQFAKAMQEASGATGQAAKESDQYANVQANLNEKWRQFKAQIGEPLLQNIVLPAMEVLSDVIDKLSTGFKALTAWVDKNQTALELVGIAAGILTAAIIAYNIAQNASAIATSIATVATTAFGAAMNFVTSPISLVVAAIGAVIAIIVLCVKHWDQIKETVVKVANTISKKVSEMVASVKQWFTNMWNSLTTIVGNIVTGLTTAFTNVKNFIIGVFTTVSTFISDIWNGICDTIKGVINNILGGVESFVNGIISAINWLIDGLNTLVEAAGELLGLDWSITRIESVSIPRLEKGGVLERGQVGLLEGTGAEAVVPLDQNRKWISAVAEDMNGSLGGNKQVQELKEAFNEFRNDLPDMLIDAFTAMKFDVNNREFARLVKAVN
jgi:hypothetical protein